MGTTVGYKKGPLSWLTVPTMTERPKPVQASPFGKQEVREAQIVVDTAVRLLTPIELKGRTIQKGTFGVVTAVNDVTYKVAFDIGEEQEVLHEEVEKVNYLSNRKAFHVPDRKRVMAPNIHANRIMVIKMADQLEKMLSKIGIMECRTKVIRTVFDPHTQNVEAALFEVTFPTEDNLIRRATTMMYYDSHNARFIPPVKMRVKGADIPFSKEAVAEVIKTQVYDKPETELPYYPQQYVKRDPARYHTTASALNSTKARVVEAQSAYRGLIEDMVKNAGTEYEFEDDKFRCLETGVPSMRHPEPEDNPFQTDHDAEKDYPTMDGEDPVRDKQDRLDAGTFVTTVSSIDPNRIVLAECDTPFDGNEEDDAEEDHIKE